MQTVGKKTLPTLHLNVTLGSHKSTFVARQTDKIPIWYRHHCLAVHGQDSADAIACSPMTLTKLEKWYQILKRNLF
jgi:hypothetical protein